MNKQSYKFPTNVPTTITFKGTQPKKTGNGQYGGWYLFNAIIDGQEQQFFLNEKPYEVFAPYATDGNTVVVTKEEQLNPANGRIFHKYKIEGASNAQKFTGGLQKTTADVSDRDEARGRTRCQVLCAWRTAGKEFSYEDLEADVDYVMDGIKQTLPKANQLTDEEAINQIKEW